MKITKKNLKSPATRKRAKKAAPRAVRLGSKFDRRGEVVAFDAKLTGEEPTWENAKDWPVEVFVRTRANMFNFYGYYLSAGDLIRDGLDWMKKNGYSNRDCAAIKNAPVGCPSTSILKLCRALNRGMPSFRSDVADHYKKTPGLARASYSDDNETVHAEIRKGLKMNPSSSEKKTPDDDEVVVETKVSPQDRIRAKVDEYILVHLEEMLDNWAAGEPKVTGVNLENYLTQNKIPRNGLKPILEWLERQLEELEGALNKTDEQLVEGYSYLTTKAKRVRIDELKRMIAEVEKYGDVKNKSRAPRKKKIKTPTQLVAKVEIAKDSPIPAEKIIDAKTAIVYNEKNGQVAVLQSSGGLSVAGKSVTGVDSGFMKKVRGDTDEFIAKIRSTRNIDKFITKEIRPIKTVERPHRNNRYRLSENILILHTA
jgi:hypothetical protein